MLGVSTATAHRAMNMLVGRNLLTRRHGQGTFVASGIGIVPSIAVRTVYILIEEHQRDLTSVPLDMMVTAVRGELPRTNVQFSFIPSEGGVQFVRQVVEAAQNSGQFAGAIPISCSREVYRYLAGTGAPVVVLGSLYPDQRQLFAVDLDYRRSGHLMAEHLAARRHRRIALFTTGEGRPGDHALCDGVSDALTAAGLSPNALLMRVVSPDMEAFGSQVAELLQHNQPPTGIICASDRLVGTVARCVRERGLSCPGDIELVFQSQAAPSAALAEYPCVRPRLSFKEVARLVAGLLKRLAAGEAVQDRQIVIPVQLHEPSREIMQEIGSFIEGPTAS
jgi:GntR family transcriptional regulator, arabinose operon transcriptional repressor